MIVDPSPERLHFPKEDPTMNPLICPLESISTEFNNATTVQLGFEGEAANIVLQKIRRGVIKSQAFLSGKDYNQEQQQRNASVVSDEETVENDQTPTTNATSIMAKQRSSRSRILCMIYTVHTGNNPHANVRAQAETWGRQCDGFIAASNFTDHSVGAIDLTHNGEEEYANMWQKTRSMFAYAYHNYDDFDFLYIGGDDVYVVVDNLRAYVDGPEVLRLEDGYLDPISKHYEARTKKWADVRPRPLIFGLPFWHAKAKSVVICGGGGYMLNRAAVEVFGERILPNWLAKNRDSREDIFTGSGFIMQDIYLSLTRDGDNGERFAGDATNLYYSDPDKSPVGTKRVNRVFGMKSHIGLDGASEQYISFHLKDAKDYLKEHQRTIPELMHRYDAFLYDKCPHRVNEDNIQQI